MNSNYTNIRIPKKNVYVGINLKELETTNLLG